MAKSGLKKVTRLRKYLNGVPTLETKENIEGDPNYIAPYLSAESCPIKEEDKTTTSTTTTSTTTTTTNAQGKTPICLSPQSAASVSGGVFLFGKNSTENSQYKVGTGTYKITGIPITHPIAFLNNGVPNFSYTGIYTGGTKVASDGNTYTFYWGDITLTILGAFTDLDYECYNHGYMGGQDNIIYDGSCQPITTTSTTTTTQKEGTMKTWKKNTYFHASNTTDIDDNTFRYICNQPNTGIYLNNFTLAGFQGTGTNPQAGDYVTSSQYGYIGRAFMSSSKEYLFIKIHDEEKVLLIRNSDGRVIKVKQCSSSATSAATQSVYISRGVRRVHDFCGTEWQISNHNLVEPTSSEPLLLDKTLFKDGASIDGQSLYYLVSLNETSTFGGTSRFNWIQIGSNGVVIANGSYRGCLGAGEAPENIF